MSRFGSVLVANRGEIACRVIRTLQALGIRSVAVFSDADRDALHVRMADAAVRLGAAPARESYLNVAAVMAAARAERVDAVHPGYGFLSESPELARACAEAGIVFVGPPVAAIELMGDKMRAKAHVAGHGVAVIPGAGEPGMSDAELAVAADAVGYPLIVKPSAGGGGKGMQLVDDAAGLPDALATARRIARAAFGDDALLVERFLSRPRHIEVQVLADAHGGVVHLGERECSLQRRHQKVVEESPSPLVGADEGLRQRMGLAACDVARSAGYTGVGTVEFLVSADRPEEFFFMEMNTRLQVEHPVTELVCTIAGRPLDLVEQQLRVAAGEPLGFAQSDVALSGHAIEARVYAEDPDTGFLPSTGTALSLREPSGDGIRVDSALYAGMPVTADYDPMLSKISAWGADRAQALGRLDRALADTLLLGLHSNIAFLRALLADPAVGAGELDTGLIGRMLDDAHETGHEFSALGEEALPAAAALLWHGSPWNSAQAGPRPGPHPDLWHRRDGWRLGRHRPPEIMLETSGMRQLVPVPEEAPHGFDAARDGDAVWLGRGGASARFRRVHRHELLAETLAQLDRPKGAAAPEVRSPMPGTIVTVTVASGDSVTAGQVVATVEAMKMEHRLLATVDGVVTIGAAEGDPVRQGQVIATIAPHEGEGN
ncbi:biotin carboxylase N-terminal domain-containing protein [Homoserinimonas aerilata]|nr:biotin carboxylase N-terminal domain-containing protein [Homoserinimonas aerilata]